MDVSRMIEILEEHFHNDINYKMFRHPDRPGFVLVNNIKVDLRNDMPQAHFAPFFKVNSIDEAKMIFSQVLPADDVETHFNLALASNPQFNASKDIYFSLYKPDRLRENEDKPFVYQ